jgi:hypothetical protein
VNPNEGGDGGDKKTSKETRVQMTKRARLWGVHGKKQGKPLFLRRGGERRTAHLDSRIVPSRQNCHIVLPSCARATHWPPLRRMRRAIDRRPPGREPLQASRDIGLKMLLWPNKAQEFTGWPSYGFDNRSRAPLE